MMSHRVLASLYATFLFFPVVHAQDTKHLSVRECPEQVTANDPSITTRKVVIASRPCSSPALELSIVDKRLGFVSTNKTLGGLPGWVRIIAPDTSNWFTTHKPCRVTYAERGIFMEWVVPRDTPCDGRNAGWYYRVYTPEKVCVMPGQHCVPIAQLPGDGQSRVKETLHIAYQTLY